MEWLWKISVVLFFSTVVSCSSLNNNSSNEYVIRYINLNVIYEYVYSNSNEAQDLKRKIDSLNERIDKIEISEAGASGTELIYYKSELVKLKDSEKKLKSEFYSRIKTALNNIAVKYKADFILNSGEGVVYSRPSYDITYEVIKELKSLEARTSPIYK